MKKYNWLLFTAVLSAILLCSAIFNYNNYARAQFALKTSYERAFSDLSDCVNNINLNLTKLMVTNDPKEINNLSVDLWREASLAKVNLGVLPTSDTELDKLESFLSQVGNYTYTLSKNISDGNASTEKDKNNLETLLSYSDKLNSQLKETEQSILNGSFSFERKNRSDKVYASDVSFFNDKISEVEETFSDYISLIYDGPFSQHLLDKKPVMTEKSKEITKEQAKEIAEKYIGRNRAKSIEVVGESEGNIPCYECRVIYNDDSDRETTVNVTKKGGFVRMFVDSRNISENKIQINDARQKAEKYLKNNGIYRMKETGYVLNNNCVELAYAYCMSDYVLYPDQIKVKVALDNGEIVGYDANSYLCSHNDERQLPENIISPEEAQDKVSQKLNVKNVQKCLIPLETGEEVYCYEFDGTYNNKEFLVYINAQTGEEENILLVADDNGSRLTL